MSKFISGRDLLTQLDMQPFELVNYVKDGHQPFDQFGRPISRPDVYHIQTLQKKLNDEAESLKLMHNWVALSPKQRADYVRSDVVGALAAQQFSKFAQSDYDRITKELKTLDRDLSQITDVSWATYKLPEDNQAAKQIIAILQSAFFKIDEKPNKPRASDETGHDTDGNLNTIVDHAKNEEIDEPKSKLNQPILETIISFIEEKPERMQESAKVICEAFTRLHKKPEEITINGVEHDVYYLEERIYCKSFFKNKTIEISISLNTFKNNYIRKAKEEIKS